MVVYTFTSNLPLLHYHLQRLTASCEGEVCVVQVSAPETDVAQKYAIEMAVI